MPVVVHADPLMEELGRLDGGVEEDGDGHEGERQHGSGEKGPGYHCGGLSPDRGHGDIGFKSVAR